MCNLLREPVLVFALNKHHTLDTPQEKHLHNGQQRQHKNIQRTSRTATHWHGAGPDKPAWLHGNVGTILLSACLQSTLTIWGSAHCQLVGRDEVVLGPRERCLVDGGLGVFDPFINQCFTILGGYQPDTMISGLLTLAIWSFLPITVTSNLPSYSTLRIGIPVSPLYLLRWQNLSR